jgi:hypothetical protein
MSTKISAGRCAAFLKALEASLEDSKRLLDRSQQLIDCHRRQMETRQQPS